MQEAQTEQEFVPYEVEGNIGGAAGGIIVLISVMVTATLMMTFGGVLSGQTYQISEAKIDAITNTTVQQAVKQSIIGGFEAQQTLGDFLPLLAIGFVVVLLMGLVMALLVIPGGIGRSGGVVM